MKNTGKIVSLIYWGSRGGGAKLFIDTAHELLSEKNVEKIILCARPSVIQQIDIKTESNKVTKIDFNPLLPSIFALIPGVSNWIVKAFFKQNMISNSSTCVVVMASPWDKSMTLKKCTNLYRVIHDATPHPGDIWPTRKTIRRLANTSKVITLSKYVANQLETPSIISSLVGPVYEADSSRINGKYFLLIGRLKEYKNLETTINLIREVSDLRIVVAGEGARKFAKPGIEIIDHWLTTDEFNSLIRNAFATVCTYSEASQSGIVEESIRWQTPVIAREIGGISEQVRNHKDGYLMQDMNSFELKKAILAIEKIDRSNIGLMRTSPSLARTITQII